jgi:hypothetical protein
MTSFWSTVTSGIIGSIVTAGILGLVGELGSLGSRWLVPAEAVIGMSGPCPSGWRRFDAATGRYLRGAEGDSVVSGEYGIASDVGSDSRGPVRAEELRSDAPRSPVGQVLRGRSRPMRVDIPSVALNFCQRR